MRRSIAVVGAAILGAGFLASLAPSTSVASPNPSPEQRAISAATSALRTQGPLFAASPDDAYQVFRTIVDPDGSSHVRYNRTYRGLPVRGGDFVIHNAPGGTFRSAGNGLAAPLALSTQPRVSSGDAATAAKGTFRGSGASVGTPSLMVDATGGTGVLAWETVVSGIAPDGQTPSKLHVITDAQTGAVRGSFDEVKHTAGTANTMYTGTVTIDTTGTGPYELKDPVRGNGYTCDMNNGSSTCSTMTDADNVWGNGLPANDQTAAGDAHFGAAKTYDYFKNVHGRNGIFGNGAGVPSRVHYGNAYINAFWDGSQMTYGDGAGNAKPLTSIDVAGHEMAHGVTEAVVSGGLTYSGESGGLNEATSDIFGNMVEFYAANASDPGDYQVGEKIDINGNGTPLRYMYNPTLDGSSHGCWSTSTQNVDVHYSSGVANHFFFNLAEGTGNTPYGNSPICGSASPVVGIGRAKAEKIWWRALDTYFTSNTRYVSTTTPANTSRAYTLSAATDLHGLCSAEYKAVQAAWTAVNVAGSDSPCPLGQDFNVSATPNSGSVNPGGSVTTTIGTTTTNGAPQTVNLSATGVPAGVTVTFVPSSVTSGNSATATIATTGSVAPGAYTITMVGTGTTATRTATYTLTVNGPPGCSGSNGTDVAIPDLSTVSSTIVISGCAGNASATSTVEVHILHTYIGDLVVSLVAPDGTAYVLHNRAGGSADNINQTYTANVSSEVANGAWKLQVQDAAAADVGTIDSWTLNLGTTGGGCAPATNGTDVAIPDLSTVSSTITIAGCAGNASSSSKVEVHILHTYIGDLVVSLVAPDGTAYVLHNRAGGSADNINQTYTVDLSSEVRNGAWKLQVQDAAAADVGTIDSWTLTL